MKIFELIESLQEFDPTMDITINGEDIVMFCDYTHYDTRETTMDIVSDDSYHKDDNDDENLKPVITKKTIETKITELFE